MLTFSVGDDSRIPSVGNATKHEIPTSNHSCYKRISADFLRKFGSLDGDGVISNPPCCSCDFEVQLFDEQGDKQDRFQTKPADKAVSWC